jgi:hypothetical protein
VALSHEESAQHRAPMIQIGAMSRPKPTPAARIAVSSFAL